MRDYTYTPLKYTTLFSRSVLVIPRQSIQSYTLPQSVPRYFSHILPEDFLPALLPAPAAPYFPVLSFPDFLISIAFSSCDDVITSFLSDLHDINTTAETATITIIPLITTGIIFSSYYSSHKSSLFLLLRLISFRIPILFFHRK